MDITASPLGPAFASFGRAPAGNLRPVHEPTDFKLLAKSFLLERALISWLETKVNYSICVVRRLKEYRAVGQGVGNRMTCYFRMIWLLTIRALAFMGKLVGNGGNTCHGKC